ncbi:intein-containing adenosylcobalamin-dependent ribonucleoside-diphosphate reductase [Candidatus Uhrbacteria bacterium]|nr:intein-containing adenosylcobalamin-dependent ribonucleoside-diphosphate reductase [Candidatus Uhrbacteria bacterium]
MREEALVARIVSQVVSRLTRQFDGHSTPTYADVREFVCVTLVDYNLPHVAKRYVSFKGRLQQEAREEVYGHGIVVGRYFTKPDVHPYDEIEWETRDASITDSKGKVVFEQKGVEVPKTWTQTATNIVVSKYFFGTIGKEDREYSVKQLVGRVAKTIANWGRKDGYFQTQEDAQAFDDELHYILVNQMAAFNSPVWFNVGTPRPQQCSACFINSVQDDMRSILNLCVTEGMLFKGGSGTGSNLSKIRSRHEYLGGSNGKASGPVSFMKGLDAFAGVIKSGGKTRRAAKMVILDIDHPDIDEFIMCKVKEEKKAWALIDAGYDSSIDGDAYASIYFQNANNSVRVTDGFMSAVENDEPWTTHAVTTGEPVQTRNARELMNMMSDAAWQCGDPGMQYDTTVNRWHTCKNTDRIYASNPCVTADTLISTDSGYRRIGELVGKDARVIAADGKSSHVTRIFPTGIKPIFELRTKSGYQLRLTEDHKVWTANRGDVPASELRIGDLLELKQPGFGNVHIEEVVAEMIGLTVGDGCLTSEQEIAFVSGGREEHGMFQSFNTRVNEYKQEMATDQRSARWSSVVDTPTGVRIGTSSRAVVEPLKRYALVDQGSLKKQFRDAIFELDKESQAALLRGLFSADGTVANYGEKSQYVGLDSVSVLLLRQVQLLLLGFGIKAKVYENRRQTFQTMMPNGRGGVAEYPVQQMHSLRISRDSRIEFERAIGFLSGSPKRAKLRTMNEEVGAYTDYFYDEFESLTEAGIEEVYDLTEPRTSHFVANGLLIHNCSEYMFLNDSACNLASLNLMRFRKPDENGVTIFDVEAFKKANEIIITAMEIIVSNCVYPTPAIEQNSHDYRPLGIGYANLGALLMSRGLAYDSDEGRNLAAAISSLQSGHCYYQSAKIAEKIGSFAGYKTNEEPCLEVMRMHRDATYQITQEGVPADLLTEARKSWDNVVEHGSKFGLRNAQISVIAPTGTISFLMDCDTTGIEPDIALVKYKWLVGGGMLKIVNQTVPEALTRLGYSDSERTDILAYIQEKDTIEGAPHLKSEHLCVFDCAFKAAQGTRTIHYMGHVHMMAAVQPFISGAISKTVNMPHEATVKEIADVYMTGWKLGLKAIAIYRDGSKRQQALTTSKESDAKKQNEDKKVEEVDKVVEVVKVANDQKLRRRRLPDERRAITHKFAVGNHEGYITVGLYDDGTPGELFLTMSKEGSVISGLMDSFATSISIGLQYGVPLEVLVNKFVHMRFEPSGYTNNPQIRIAKSITDYIFRWLALKFLPRESQLAVGINGGEEIEEVAKVEEVAEVGKVETAEKQPNLFEAKKTEPLELRSVHTQTFDNQSDAPACDTCGSMMVRNAACYKCLNCGATSGCS